MLLAVAIVKVHHRCLFDLSARINRSFSTELLPSQLVWNSGLELNIELALTLLLKYPRRSCSGLQFNATPALTKLARLYPTAGVPR